MRDLARNVCLGLLAAIIFFIPALYLIVRYPNSHLGVPKQRYDVGVTLFADCVEREAKKNWIVVEVGRPEDWVMYLSVYYAGGREGIIKPIAVCRQRHIPQDVVVSMDWIYFFPVKTVDDGKKHLVGLLSWNLTAPDFTLDQVTSMKVGDIAPFFKEQEDAGLARTTDYTRSPVDYAPNPNWKYHFDEAVAHYYENILGE